MRIIKYFESKEDLSRLLEDINEIVSMIDDYSQKFMQGVMSTSNDYREALNQLTGAYMYLEPLYSLAVAHKENEELAFYVALKRELESKGEKVVAASLDKEASLSVADIRRIRNILEAYVESCSKAIITCQTQIRRIEDDFKHKPLEEAK